MRERNSNSIEYFSTTALTKKELIQLIEKNFPEDHGNIVEICSVIGNGYDPTSQAVIFAKMLRV